MTTTPATIFFPKRTKTKLNIIDCFNENSAHTEHLH
jgi:hypothetical protein